MYDLHKLGWRDFQHLCLTIAREILGQTVESFLDSNDGGRDGAFAGTWKKTGSEELRGQFVIQCKFTSRAGHGLKASDLQDEAKKATRLVAARRCDCYVLMTNAGVSGSEAERIETLFKSTGVKHVVQHGSSWICQQIRENKRLRMMVPRVYGLGDLGQILDERAYAQARELLATLREDMAKVVVTGAYQKAATALDEHGFVLLIGEPAAGKTTIASLLAMATLDQWGASTLKLDHPGKVVEHWNPEERSQFFWVDDAFGVQQYEYDLAHGWNHALPQVKAMLHQGHKIVMTSRDYIYRRARRDLKESAFPLLRESQVVIDVRDLTADEKKQILYNHIKLGRQPKEFRRAIKPYLDGVAGHPRFIPETARRLGDPLFTGGLSLTSWGVPYFVEKQEQFLQDVVRGLDSDSKAALALIYMRNGSLESPVEPQPSESKAIERLGSTLGGCMAALEAMEGGLAQHVHVEGGAFWRFKHPTIGDAFAALIVQSAELLGIYLQGTPPEDMIGQITCADVGIERAVVIPKALFPVVIARLDEFSAHSGYKSPVFAAGSAQSRVRRFLAHRCSAEFLAEYVEKHPELLSGVAQPGLFLDSVPEVLLASKLHECGILPEDKRKMFVATVTEYAVEGQDLQGLENPYVREVFTEEEFEEMRSRVRAEVLPRLADIRLDWELNASGDQSPDEYMQPLLDSYEILKREFGHDDEAVAAIERQMEHVNVWVGEQMPEEPDDDGRERRLGNVKARDASRVGRSVFDDVDA
jgi:hypothetical protein